ncbi:unnamed protein product, partial [Tetraodon nigroviridis]
EDHTELDPAVLATLKKLQDGYYGGARIQTGKLSEFVTTSCLAHLSFLDGKGSGGGSVATRSMMMMVMMMSVAPMDTCMSYGVTMKPQRPAEGGLGRFKAVASKTKEMVALKNRAQGLDVHGESVPPGRVGGLRRRPQPSSLWSLPRRQHVPVQQALPLRPAGAQPEPPRRVHATGRPGVWRRPSPPPLRPLLPPAFKPCVPQVPEVVVSAESGIPRDAGGAIDYLALAQLLRDTQSLQDQADILYILFKDKGMDWDTRLHGRGSTVRSLLTELYDKAGELKHWSLIRMTSGMLRKKVEELD